MSWIVSVILVVVLLAAFGLLMVCLLAALPEQPLDEEAEAIRKDYEERERKRKAREERRKRK